MCGLFLKRLHASKTVTLLNLFTKTCNKCLPLHVQVVVAWKRWENVYGNCLKIVDWLMEGFQGRSSEVNWYLAAAVLIHFVPRVLIRFQFLSHCTKNVQIRTFPVFGLNARKYRPEKLIIYLWWNFSLKSPYYFQKQRCSVQRYLRPATLLKNRPWRSCFSVNFGKFLRTHFFINHL